MSRWPFSSSASGSDAQAQAQAQIQSDQPPSIPSNPPSPKTTISATQDADFYAAHPHLAPSDPTTTPASQNGVDDEFDHTLPRTMSCRAAFDSAFYCSSFGGHFNDIYRHGQLRSCSDHWSDFWFCMRTNNSYSGGDVKQRLIQQRYKEKEEKLKAGPNSEDVWKKRGSGEEVVGAFALPEVER